MSCLHYSKIGDNYGLTCVDCGKVLEGYGNWAEGSKTCTHKFLQDTLESKYETCLYCEQERIADDNEE